MHAKRLLMAALLALVMAGPAAAQRRTDIQEGSTAPGLDIENWHEEKSTSVEAGNVYLVVFARENEFNTRSALGLAAILEILKLHESKKLRVIVVMPQLTDLRLGGINHENLFIGGDRRNSSERAWVSAAGQNTKPVVFIVDRKSKIQFIGSPADDRFREVLPQVLDDRYDSVMMRQAQPFIGPAENARKVRNYRQCFMHLDKIIEMDKRIFARYRLMKFEIMLIDQADTDAAYDYAREQVAQSADDPAFLRWMAEFIVNDPRLSKENRDLDFALEVADSSAGATAADDPQKFALPAMVHFHRGELAEAVELQEQAWLVAKPERKDTFWRTLIAYKDAARRQGVLSSRR